MPGLLTTSFERPRDRPSAQRRAGERPAQAVGRHARGIAADRQQRDEVAHRARAGRARPPPWSARTTRAAADRADVSTGERRVREQQQVRELVVEPRAAERAEERRPRSRRPPGRPPRPARCRRHPCRAGGARPGRRHRPGGSASAGSTESRSPIEPVGTAAEPIERAGAAVGRDDQVGAVEPRPRRSGRGPRTPRRPPSSASTCIGPETTSGTLGVETPGARRCTCCVDFLRRHDPDQVRGSADAWASTLSALPRSPVGSGFVDPA